MTQLERQDLHAAIDVRYPDNTTEDITPKRLRDGLHELVDSVFVTATDTGGVPNVPLYQATATYAVGFVVRYTLPGSAEAFFAALQNGKLPAPVGVGDVNWKVVPGPVSATQLGQFITLAQARSINGDTVVLGRDYEIELPQQAAGGHAQYLSVAGIAENWFSSEGWLIVNNVRTKVKNIDYVAGTWEVDTRYTKAQTDQLLAGKADLDANGRVPASQLPPSGASTFAQLGGLPADNAALSAALAARAALYQFVGTPSQPQDVVKDAFYYLPGKGIYQRTGGDATVSSLDTSNTASWLVLLEQAEEVDIFPSQAKRNDVINRFTAGLKKIADVPLAGDTKSYFFSKFYHFPSDYYYECLPNPDDVDANGVPKAWWVKLANN